MGKPSGSGTLPRLPGHAPSCQRMTATHLAFEDLPPLNIFQLPLCFNGHRKATDGVSGGAVRASS